MKLSFQELKGKLANWPYQRFLVPVIAQDPDQVVDLCRRYQLTYQDYGEGVFALDLCPNTLDYLKELTAVYFECPDQFKQ